MQIVISAHARERMKERLNGMKSQDRRQRVAWDAYMTGIRYEEATGIDKKCLLSARADMAENEGKDLALYMDSIFVFANNILVTVLPRKKCFERSMRGKRAKRNRAIDRAERHEFRPDGM